MQAIDYILVVLYLAFLLWLGFTRRGKADSGPAEVILGGRMLTLPAFVASLVSTWYGGILGVGEFSYRFGIANWLVFGVPYYLAAFLFALFLAKKAREAEVLTIPERLQKTYGNGTALAGSVIIYFITIPAAYILMLGVLIEKLFGWPFWAGVLIGTVMSVAYVYMGGFRSVVRTDVLQFVLMFLGFGILFAVLITKYGGFDFLQKNLPASYLTWDGGNSPWYIAVWYVIALMTLIDPSFHQRCYAARTPSIARRGIYVSILCWFIFDFLTTSCGLYARAILPNLADPVASYPALAVKVLPVGLMGIFALALLATVMSTVDSYSFLAASTFGNDIMPHFKKLSRDGVVRWTRVGLVISTVLSVVIAVYFQSVVEIWYAFGSISTPALLLPVFLAFVGKYRLPGSTALMAVIVSGSLSLVWYFAGYLNGGEYWFSIEPIFPGLVFSIVVHLLFVRKEVHFD